MSLDPPKVTIIDPDTSDTLLEILEQMSPAKPPPPPPIRVKVASEKRPSTPPPVPLAQAKPMVDRRKEYPDPRPSLNGFRATRAATEDALSAIKW